MFGYEEPWDWESQCIYRCIFGGDGLADDVNMTWSYW